MRYRAPGGGVVAGITRVYEMQMRNKLRHSAGMDRDNGFSNTRQHWSLPSRKTTR